MAIDFTYNIRGMACFSFIWNFFYIYFFRMIILSSRIVRKGCSQMSTLSNPCQTHVGNVPQCRSFILHCELLQSMGLTLLQIIYSVFSEGVKCMRSSLQKNPTICSLKPTYIVLLWISGWHCKQEIHIFDEKGLFLMHCSTTVYMRNKLIYNDVKCIFMPISHQPPFWESIMC